MQADKFARKIFLSKKQQNGLEEWCKLVQIHKFVEKPHEHIIKILGAFQYGNSFSIIFPLAECSLEDYLQGDASFDFDSEHTWKQMQGIADGLAFLHGLREDEPNEDKKKEYISIAYHLDLKPENILIINNIFQITDFGLATVKKKLLLKQLESDSDGAGNAGGYSPYAPPEHGTRTEKDYAAHDIWSLGAIFSEIATHDINAKGTPKSSVEQYRTDLRMDDKGMIRSRCFHKDRKMKDAIYSQHDHLYRALHDRGSRHQNTFIRPWQVKFYTGEFFRLIHKTLDHIVSGRGTAKDVVKKLAELFTETESQLSFSRNLRIKDTPVSVSRDIFQETEDHEIQKVYKIPNNVPYL